MTKLLQSSAIRAFLFKMEEQGQPIELTVDDLQKVKDYEQRHGRIEIAAIMEDRTIKLRIAKAWPEDEKVDLMARDCSYSEDN